MATQHEGRRARVTGWSWLAVSLLGLLMLTIPAYDIWDDVTGLSWSLTATLVENSVFILLALGLVYGGIWLALLDWEPEYKWTVTKWNLGVAAGIAVMYAVVITIQLSVMGRLKPWVLALDGVLFGSVAAFGVGTYNAAQQQVRDDLARSREEYRTLTDDVLDTSEVATFVLDDEFDVVWINEATAAYFDVDREAVLGRDKRELVDEHIAGLFERPERFADRVTATYDDNSDTEEFECHLLADDGHEERWLRHWSQPVESGLYEGGRIEHYTDVTELKRREQELDRRERKLREMYDLVSDASLSFREQVDGVIGIGRDLFDAEYGAFARTDGENGVYEPRVVQAERVDLDAGDVVPLAETHCRHVVEDHETLRFATRPFDGPPSEHGTDVGFESYVGTPVVEGDETYGTLCFLDRTGAEPFDSWQGTMVELMGNWIGYELTRERLLERRERELRTQEATFEQFVDAVDDYAIFTLDADGVVTSWNEGAARITGFDADEAVGERLDAFTESVRDGSVADVARQEAGNANDSGDVRRDAGSEAAGWRLDDLRSTAAETGQASDEGWRVRRDGTRLWADVTVATRSDGAGEHAGFTVVVRDLTDQRERERALEHERERLEFLNRILRHNILNGLNLVKARADLLDGRHVDDPDAVEHLDTIRGRVEDLSSLIDTMRTFMDAILADADHDVEPVAVREELEEKVSLARESYVEAVFDVHDLPDGSTTVAADPLVGEVFENVLSNAVVHNDAPTPRVEIWTTESTREVAVDPETGDPVTDESAANTTVRERPALAVHVADNGPGIPDDEKEAVLEKGVSELAEPGNGFGLYLVKEMMRAYGGDVHLRDHEGGGTVVDLVFLLED